MNHVIANVNNEKITQQLGIYTRNPPGLSLWVFCGSVFQWNSLCFCWVL